MTAKFPVDAPRSQVIKAFEILGFRLVRERELIAWYARTLTGVKRL